MGGGPIEDNSKISIWWDIENCHVPKAVEPISIAQNLSSALRHASITGPIEIQCFGDTQLLHRNTQKALSDTGITLNHVPRGNKEAADKAILVAMLLWALDNPPPAHILLISGDGDFANALHRLRHKTYRILLASPAQHVKLALLGAAHKHWKWADLLNGRVEEAELPQHITQCIKTTQEVPSLQKDGSTGSSSSSVGKHYTSPCKVSKVEEVEKGNNFQPMVPHMPQTLPSRSESSHLPSEDKRGVMMDGHTTARNSDQGYTPQHGQCAERDSFSGFPNQNSITGINVPPTASSYNFCAASCERNEILAGPSNGGLHSRIPLVEMENCSIGRQPISAFLNPSSTMPPPIAGKNANDAGDGNAISSITMPTFNTTNMPFSQAGVFPVRNLKEFSHDLCLDKVYSAMKTLEHDMIAPTESNLFECIQYWDPVHKNFNINQTLNIAANFRQVIKTQSGRGSPIMYFPPVIRPPWTCLDPHNMQSGFSEEVWYEMWQFLSSSDKPKHLFLSTQSWYEAAQILKSSSSSIIKKLEIGRIIQLIYQAIYRREWLEKGRREQLVLRNEALQGYAQKRGLGSLAPKWMQGG